MCMPVRRSVIASKSWRARFRVCVSSLEIVCKLIKSRAGTKALTFCRVFRNVSILKLESSMSFGVRGTGATRERSAGPLGASSVSVPEESSVYPQSVVSSSATCPLRLSESWLVVMVEVR